jgi:DNA repair protein RecO (recombination protein O)
MTCRRNYRTEALPAARGPENLARAVASQTGFRTRALLLRRVAYADSDLILTLLTEELGRVSALARGARRSQRRFGGALEPIHTLRVALDERSTSELYILREASIDTPRHFLTSNLEALDAAGRALGWLRQAFVPRTPEPLAWASVTLLLNRLDRSEDDGRARIHLAEFGIRLLAALGWGLDFERCVRCGKTCEAEQSAFVDAACGGLICRACGGARLRLESVVRKRLVGLHASAAAELLETDVDVALNLVEAALRTHLGAE